MSRIRLATFNLENLGARRRGDPDTAERVVALRPLLLRLEADIVCLQEVNATHEGGGPRRFAALEALVEGTAYAGYARAHAGGTGPANSPPADIHNLVTLSRFPIAAARAVRHDFVAPPEWRPRSAAADLAAAVQWDRPLLHTVHAVPGGPALHVVNLHLRAPLAANIPGQKLASQSWRSAAAWAEGFYLAALKRGGQALEARLLVEQIFDAEPTARIAVCGDFNAELAETPLRATIAAVEDTGNAVLAGRALHPVETLAPAASRYSVLYDGREALVDHVVVSVDLRRCLVGVEILNQGLQDEAQTPGAAIPGSYHAPIVAEFDL
jgi:endonuclease/exonuclease/phosphatase family metal-dependent hydrolase